MTSRKKLLAMVAACAVGAGCQSLPTFHQPVNAGAARSAPGETPSAARRAADEVTPAGYLHEEGDQAAAASPEEILPPDLGNRSAESAPGSSGTDFVGNFESAALELSLPALEQMALANNPTLRQASALVAEARGRWVQAGLYPNPEVGYAGTEIGNEGQAGQHGGYVSQTIVTGGKLDWSRAAAAREVDRASAELRAQQLRVLTDVRIRFYEALGAQHTVQLASELRSIAQQGVRLAQQLEAALEAPRTDVLQSEVELATVELLLENSRQREFAARQALAAIVGVPELPCTMLVGTLDEEILPWDWCATYNRLVETSPLLQMAQARIAQAQAQIRREQLEPVPDLSVQVGSQHDFATDDTIYSAQVQVPLPLYNRNQGNISAATAEWRQALDEAARIERVLQQRLAEVWRRYAAAQTQAEIYRNRILPRSQQTLELTTQAYQGAQLDFLRVLNARRTYFENRLRYLEAQIDLQKATAELDGLLLTGGLDAPGENNSVGDEE